MGLFMLGLGVGLVGGVLYADRTRPSRAGEQLALLPAAVSGDRSTRQRAATVYAAERGR